MKKNSLVKFGLALFSSLFFIGVTFSGLIAKPAVGLAPLSSPRESVADERNREILAQNNTLEAGDDNTSVEDPTLDKEEKETIDTKNKGVSSEDEAPLEDDAEDVRNGPDDPE